MVDENPKFTTKRRSIGSNGELKWGGDDGEPWSEALESSSNMTVTDDGTITSGSEIPDSVVDDFDRTSPLDEYSGDTASFTTEGTIVFEGNQSLKAETQNITIMAPTGSDRMPVDGHFPQQGTRFTFKFYMANSNSGGSLAFGVQDSDNYYYLRMGRPELDFELFKVENGDQSDVGVDTNYSPPTGEWLKGQVEWFSDGTFNCKAFNASGTELASFSANDSTFSDGGIGWRTSGMYGDYPTYFDYVFIEDTL